MWRSRGSTLRERLVTLWRKLVSATFMILFFPLLLKLLSIGEGRDVDHQVNQSTLGLPELTGTASASLQMSGCFCCPKVGSPKSNCS